MSELDPRPDAPSPVNSLTVTGRERSGITFKIALGLLAAMSATAVDIVIPVSPQIERAYGIPPQEAQLALTAYITGMALGLIPVGLLSDRYGRRPVFKLCVALFSIAGAAMALPLGFGAMLWLRFAQGFAGACGPALSRAIIRDLDLPDSGTRLMALVTAVLSMAPLLGPLAGGWMADYMGWRATFWTSAAYGAVTLLALIRWMPESRKHPPSAGMSQQMGNALHLVLGSRQALISIVLFALPFAGYFAALTSLSQVMSDMYGMPSSRFGTLFGLTATTYFSGAIISRQLLASIERPRVLRFGMAILGIAAAGCVALLAVARPAEWAIWCAASFYMLGMAICLPITTMAALAPLARAAGLGAAILGAVQIGVGALGSMLSARLYDGSHQSMIAVMAFAALCAVVVHALFGRLMWEPER